MSTPRNEILDAAELELIDDILDACFNTENARDVARYNIRIFARWLATQRRKRLADATAEDCKAYLKHRSSEIKPNTLAKNFSDLRAWYAAAAGDIADPLDGRQSPMARIKQPRTPKFTIKHAATVDEVDALLAGFDRRDAVGLRNAAMVSLMFRSGLRVSEVAGLHMAELDIDGRGVHLPMTKNGQPRIPGLHPETLTLLKRYLRRRGDHPGPVFVSAGPRSISEGLPTDAIKTVVKRAAAKAGVPISPHCLRRGFVVEYLTHGGDIATLMILGGWESETMIVRYMGDRRNLTARTVYDTVAVRQVAARRRRLNVA